jgi:signal transduction histidine kinase
MEQAAGKAKSGALRVLHLEDDANDAAIVQGMLEAEGLVCELRRVETREDFTAALELSGLDLILADFALPSFDGLEALRIARERHPELPFIFVSGRLGEEVAIEALKLGATDYVLKERLSRLAGSVRRALHVVADRTELRRMEARLRQAQRLEAMGTLTGGIAHDFNNILGAILGYGERALRDAPLGTRLARDLEHIMAAGERGRMLVERMLAFSRNDVGERVAVHVEAVVREALDVVAAGLPQGVSLEATLKAGRARAHCDAAQVREMVMNLATNAIQAMPSGGSLRVKLEILAVGTARVATIGTLGVGQYIVLEVADTGTGIAPEVVERIFDPFYTTKDVNVGTGLGLSLVHGVVTDIGGAIDVASQPGQGSVFTVYLPRSGDVAEQGAP